MEVIHKHKTQSECGCKFEIEFYEGSGLWKLTGNRELCIRHNEKR